LLAFEWIKSNRILHILIVRNNFTKEIEMKMKWILLYSFCVTCLQANAEQSVVIDANSLGVSSSKAESNTSAPSDTKADANAVNKERMLKGGKLSPRERREVAKAAMADSNLQAGADFMATHKAKPGVVSLASGVQYKILKASKGKKPTENSVIRCRYKGKLIDGSTIDKTDSKKPSSMNVSGFLPGLKEAVQLMPNGSKWEVVIPPQLAYGAIGNRGVGPNAVLIYEIELLGIK
jgi:FKBP-type peptidyl-prolyl cis-trans isomerase